jgi:hypothetical protein
MPHSFSSKIVGFLAGEGANQRGFVVIDMADDADDEIGHVSTGWRAAAKARNMAAA